jgi:hypothetical protein
MAREQDRTRTPGRQGQPPAADEPLPGAGDPGGASHKGYSADPQAGPPVPDEDPVPLAEVPEGTPRTHKPAEGPLPPTGRSRTAGYSPNDRLMGSDR